MGPGDLAQVLHQLPFFKDNNVLVGLEPLDDAAVYKLSEDIGLVLTVDYFTPIVDDPYAFGAIAAANALSDIYAMGARPLAMLNIIGFPVGDLPLEVMAEILKGGAEKAQEAGVPVVGGHSIDDKEPKCGYAVVGLVHPKNIYRKSTARVGDTLVLTKPLGMGIISTAIKRQRASTEMIEEAVEVMSTLNRAASEAMVEIGANACTDVTGFGLLGHLYEITRTSRVSARIHLGEVPVLPETWELAAEGLVPGGTRRNRDYLEKEKAVVWADGLAEEGKVILCDAQTSGGLLISVPRDKSQSLLSRLHDAGVKWAAAIGEVVEDHEGQIEVVP